MIRYEVYRRAHPALSLPPAFGQVRNHQIHQIAVRESKLMRRSWLESKTISILFTCSAWGVAFFIAVALFGTTSWFHHIEASHAGKLFSIALVIVTVTIGAVAMLMITFGMAIFTVWRDSSSVGIKILWLLLFFFTAPLGPILYFLTVYRKRVGGPPRESVVGLGATITAFRGPSAEHRDSTE